MPILDNAQPRAVETSLPDLPPLRVLAAEDNATNRIILQSMLKALGVTAEIASSGDALLQRCEEEAFDVILLDIAMPGRDGVETLQELRARAALAGRPMPPALAVTANAMTHQIADYIDKGFAGVVPKPLRAEELSRALAGCVASVVGTP